MRKLADYIRNIPDFPRPGIQFKDITPLLQSPAMLDETITQLAQPFKAMTLSAVVGIEARGFIFASLLARELGLGFVPLRKAGKLPYRTQSISYQLEYGCSALEIHSDALAAGDRIVLVDDLLATGGTAAAGCRLIEQCGAQVVACAFVIALDALQGWKKLKKYQLHSLLHC